MRKMKESWLLCVHPASTNNSDQETEQDAAISHPFESRIISTLRQATPLQEKKLPDRHRSGSPPVHHNPMRRRTLSFVTRTLKRPRIANSCRNDDISATIAARKQERGCVEDQPQQQGLCKPHRISNAQLLRLVEDGTAALQPKKFFFPHAPASKLCDREFSPWTKNSVADQ